MTYLESLHANRWHRAVAIIITIVAAAAALADQPPGSSVSSRPVTGSGSVTLSPSRLEVRIPFTLTESEAAASGQVRVLVSIDPVWVGVEDTTIARGPDVSVETLFSLIRPSSGYANSQLTCGRECLGSNELVLRWPLEIENGSVTIDWEISAHSDFDTNNPPDGAEITLDVEAPPADPDPLVAHFVQTTWERRVVVLDFRVVSDRPLEPGALAIHRPFNGSGDFVGLLQDGEWVDLPVQRGLPINIPEECLVGPCAFDIRSVVGQWITGGTGSTLLRFVGPNVEGTPRVVVQESEPWRSSSATDEQQVSLFAAEPPVFTVPVHVEFSGEVDDGIAFFVVSVVTELLDISSEHARVNVTATSSIWGSTHMDWLREKTPTGERVLVVPAQCDDRRCFADLDLVLTVSSDERTEDPSAQVRVVVDPVLLAPDEVATGGNMVVQVGGGS